MTFALQTSWKTLRTGGLLALALGLSVSLAACGDKTEEASGTTVASVNGEDIKSSQVDTQLAQIPANLLNGRENEVRRQIVDGLINQDLLMQAAKKEDVTDLPEYKTQLALFEKQLQANLVIAKKVSETVTPEKLQEAYEATKAQRAYPAVKAKHILVPTEQQALDIIKIATPANFSQLATQYSKGPSADKGGDLGWFRRESMIPEFASVAFSTPVGSVAQTPVKTQFGWHVILVEDRSQQYMPPFEQVEPELRNELTQTVVQGYLQDLRKNATITYADGSGTETSPTTTTN